MEEEQRINKVMRKTLLNHRIVVVLFCIALFTTGMYTPDKSIDFSSSYTKIQLLESSIFKSIAKMDIADQFCETETEEMNEVGASVSTDFREAVSFKGLSSKYVLVAANLPFIPVLIVCFLALCLQKAWMNQRYLILYIHNSDGKKRAVSFCV